MNTAPMESQEAAQGPENVEAGRRNAALRVLLVDDNEAFLKELAALLERNGYTVDVCTNAVDAVERLANDSYEFVFVDHKMPEKDGLWMIEHARKTRETKILLLTGSVSRDVIGRAFRLGACGYLIKPVDESDVMRHLMFHSHAEMAGGHDDGREGTA